MKRAVALAVAVIAVACVSPTSCQRELRSGRRKPADNELIGTWHLTPASVRVAAASGLKEADLTSNFLTFAGGGSCTADVILGFCGGDELVKRSRGACRWAVDDVMGDGYQLVLTFEREGRPYLTFLQLFDDDQLKLWDYVCDPDAGTFVEFVRTHK